MLPKASIKDKTLRKKKEAVCSNIIKQQKGFDSYLSKPLFVIRKSTNLTCYFLRKRVLKAVIIREPIIIIVTHIRKAPKLRPLCSYCLRICAETEVSSGVGGAKGILKSTSFSPKVTSEDTFEGRLSGKS